MALAILCVYKNVRQPVRCIYPGTVQLQVFLPL